MLVKRIEIEMANVINSLQINITFVEFEFSNILGSM